jgi:hypothetical protein
MRFGGIALGMSVCYTTIISNVVMFVSIMLFGVLLPKKKRNLANLTVWDQVGSTSP